MLTMTNASLSVSFSAAARSKARRLRLVFEIVAGLVGVMLGTALSFAVAPAHAATPIAAHHATPKRVSHQVASDGDDGDQQDGGDDADEPEPEIEPALLTITAPAPLPEANAAGLIVPPASLFTPSLRPVRIVT